jgi:hypothetical protein
MIELTTLISELRRQLASAVAEGANEKLRLELGQIEIETTVVASQEGDISGKVRFWVVEAGGNAKESESATQRIKLTLQPKLAGSSDTPWVHGTRGTRER